MRASFVALGESQIKIFMQKNRLREANNHFGRTGEHECSLFGMGLPLGIGNWDPGLGFSQLSCSQLHLFV